MALEGTIGSYRIVELLGSGAMGEVYKAADEKLFGRIIALKVLSERLSKNESARIRFEREVRTAASLEHPHIVTIHDQGDHEGRPYFVMEFLDGQDLAARIGAPREGRALERDLDIARQLSEALDFAHTRNVIHRDIKPGNVVVVRRGETEQAKLVDFGIVHVEDSKLTRAETQPGTYSYMSPEQLRNDASIDHRSDLFSLGIVLYELFTGVHPFDGPSEALITHHILQKEPDSPRRHNAAIPSAVDVLILKLLEKDPAHRPQTAAEVAETLRHQSRRLQSRWASTDPAEYENLDEIARDAVEKLVAWARQKEADGDLAAALGAYEKALGLAPESDRIKRKLPKLRHKIESDRMFRSAIEEAESALRETRLGDARAALKRAWVIHPESEDVAALELRIDEAEKEPGEDEERAGFVAERTAAIDRDLDEGRVHDARRHVVEILQRYPDEPIANLLLERLLVIAQSGVDYRAYRSALAEAREALSEGRLEEARGCCGRAEAMWPGDEEAATLAREIRARVDVEIGALMGRVEKRLLEAEEPERDEREALESVAAARAETERALSLGGDAGWGSTTRDAIARAESGVRERRAKLEEARRKQDEERSRRLDLNLQRGRNLLREAESLAARGVEEAASAARAYESAKEAFERVLTDEAEHDEARNGRRAAEEAIRRLAEEARREDERREAARREKEERLSRQVADAVAEGRRHLENAERLAAGTPEDLARGEEACAAGERAFRKALALDPGAIEATAGCESLESLRQHLRAEIERREAERRREVAEARSGRDAEVDAAVAKLAAEFEEIRGLAGTATAVERLDALGRRAKELRAEAPEHAGAKALLDACRDLRRGIDRAAPREAPSAPPVDAGTRSRPVLAVAAAGAAVVVLAVGGFWLFAGRGKEGAPPPVVARETPPPAAEAPPLDLREEEALLREAEGERQAASRALDGRDRALWERTRDRLDGIVARLDARTWPESLRPRAAALRAELSHARDGLDEKIEIASARVEAARPAPPPRPTPPAPSLPPSKGPEPPPVAETAPSTSAPSSSPASPSRAASGFAGRVLTEGGAPLAGGTIAFEDMTSGRISMFAISADGSYEAALEPPGRVRVQKVIGPDGKERPLAVRAQAQSLRTSVIPLNVLVREGP